LSGWPSVTLSDVNSHLFAIYKQTPSTEICHS
jgi:hypothetical protein